MFRIDRRLVNISKIQDVKANEDFTLELRDAEPVPEEETAPETVAEEAIEETVEEDTGGLDQDNLDYLTGVARDMVAQAAVEAGVKLQAAEMEATQIKAMAQREGFEEGKRQALEEMAAERERERGEIARLLDEIDQARTRMLDEFEAEIIDLTLAIVKKIVNVSIKKDDKVFESMLKKALQQMKWEGQITIRVSGEEYERFFSSGSAKFVVGDKTISATILEDPALDESGLIIESEGETVDASLDTQLKYLRLAFEKREGGER